MLKLKLTKIEKYEISALIIKVFDKIVICSQRNKKIANNHHILVVKQKSINQK